MYKKIQKIYRSLDWSVAIIAILIIVVDYLLLARTRDYSLKVYNDPNAMLFSQTLWFIIGFITMIGISLLDYHYWRRIALILEGLTIIILIGTIISISGRTDNSILLTPNIPLFLFDKIPLFYINIRSLAIFSTTIYVSTWLYSKRKVIHDIQYGLFPLAIILGYTGGLLILIPDVTGAALIFITGLFLFFLLGDVRHIFVFILTSLISGWFVVRFSATGQVRVFDYLRIIRDPSNSSLQLYVNMINSGGYWGSNLLLSHYSTPDLFTFGTYATIVNQCGLVIGLLLIILIILFVVRGNSIMRRAKDLYGQLLAVGVVFMIGIRYILALAVILGYLPVATIDLPLIGLAGTDLIVIFIGIGILLSVSRFSGKIGREELADNLTNTSTSNNVAKQFIERLFP